MGQFIKVAKVSEISPGNGKQIDAGGRTIALFNLKGQFYAIDNSCTHVGGSLASGEIIDEDVICPLHGARFNIPTGKVLGSPARENISTYQIRIDGDNIEIEV